MMQNSFHDPKKVKAAAPIDTVARVREILYRLEVMVMETFHESVCDDATYSCTLELGDPPMNRRGMTVNGKGMTPRLAQASAYGELMERMQCGELPPPLVDDHLSDDAVLMSVQRYADECPEELLHMIGLSNRAELAEFLCKTLGDAELCLVPFRSHGKTVLLPEATSALDNITQRHISDSLRELKCTRIAVAHRLSTIQDCDRILVLDGGKIIEDGTYEQLLEQRGFFYDLVQRQLLEQ